MEARGKSKSKSYLGSCHLLATWAHATYRQQAILCNIQMLIPLIGFPGTNGLKIVQKAGERMRMRNRRWKTSVERQNRKSNF